MRKYFTKISFIFCSVALLLPSCSSAQKDSDSALSYLHADGSAWRLAIAKTSNEYHDYLVYGTYQNNLVCQATSDIEPVWNIQLEAFPFAVKTADINNDGKDEIFATTASGKLYAYSLEGNLLWTFSSALPFYDVAIGRFFDEETIGIAVGGIDRTVYLLNNEGELKAEFNDIERVVQRINTVDLNNDGQDELLIVDNKTWVKILQFEKGKLLLQNSYEINLPNNYLEWHNPDVVFFPFTTCVADLNNDGNPELIHGDVQKNAQAVTVTNSEGQVQWLSERTPMFHFYGNENLYSEFYSTAFVQAADIDSSSAGLEVISVAGGLLRVFSAEGKLLEKLVAPVGFTDFIMCGKTAYLGSSPNGDNTIYKIDFEKNWKVAFSSITRQGIAKEIGNNLSELLQKVENYTISANPDSITRYYFQTGTFGEKENQWLKTKFPYPNIQYLNSEKLIEENPPVDENGRPWSLSRWRIDTIRGTMSKSEIIEKARFVEANKLPTLFYMGHSCTPFISVETAEEVMKAAPNYCMGFQTSEDEELELIPRYFKYYYSPLSDACKRNSVPFNITKNKGTWWISSPSIPEVYNALFENGHNKTLVAATEDSNSRTPELNIMGRSGLWLAGLVDHIFINLNSDLFSFNRFFQWEYPKHGHPYLRRMVAHTLLGGSMYHIRFMDKMETDNGFVFSQMGKESSEIFYHLLGKGLVFKPDRNKVRGFNPIGFVVHQPSDNWMEDAYNGHNPERWVPDEELDSAVIPHNGCLWGMTPTPEHAIQKVLMHKERQFGQNIPATPYGLVAFVPEFTNLDSVSGISEWWHTDGIYAWKEGQEKLTGINAARAIKNDFEKAASTMLFKTIGDDVFMQVVEMGPNRYRVFLIDPNWLNPRKIEVTLISQQSNIKLISDVLDGKHLSFSKRQCMVKLDAGSLRILEVETE